MFARPEEGLVCVNVCLIMEDTDLDDLVEMVQSVIADEDDDDVDSDDNNNVCLTGQTEEGLVCVKFGLITEDTDLDDLVEMVQSAGKDVEESSKVSALSVSFSLILFTDMQVIS